MKRLFSIILVIMVILATFTSCDIDLDDLVDALEEFEGEYNSDVEDDYYDHNDEKDDFWNIDQNIDHTEPAETEPGKNDICGGVIGELLPPPHTCSSADPSIEWEVIKNATCFEEGLRMGQCKTCWTRYEEDIPAGHTIVAYGYQEASCTRVGWEAYEECLECDYSTYVEIPVSDHDYTYGDCIYCGDMAPS